MTVNFEVPTVKYVGNGVSTSFPFTWSSGYPDEIYVKHNDVLLIEGTTYELEDYTESHGGVIVFGEAPASEDEIIIYRQTPITQQVDYEEGKPFPADTHEFQMDKDTRILQEMIGGGRILGGRVDLEAIHLQEEVEIDNSSGNNAHIVPWTVDGLLSGAMHGEFIEHDAVKPIDGEATARLPGFIWWVLSPPVIGVGDPNILMSTLALLISTSAITPDSAVAQFRFEANTGKLKYGDNPTGDWTEEDGLFPVPTGLQEYYITWVVQSGSCTEGANSPIDTWIDVYSLIGQPNEFAAWSVSDPGPSQECVAHFAIAPDDGGGNPDTNFMVTRAVKLLTEQSDA